MYCINCGVQMEDGARKCPLCGTVLSLIPQTEGDAEPAAEPRRKLSRDGVFILITAAALLVIATSLAIDLSVSRRLTWAGYVAGGVLLCYMTSAFPLWLRAADKLVIVAAEYGAIALYLLALEQTIGGGWYFPVALPMVLLTCLITMAIMLLARRYPMRALAIAGGTWIAAGGAALVLDSLLHRAFDTPYMRWSPWVMLGCAVVGGLLITIALCEPLREKLIKRMFI